MAVEWLKWRSQMTDDLLPGREMDALVAEKVMGLVVLRDERTVQNGRYQTKNGGDYIPMGLDYYTQGCPEYSTSIAAAWEVVERMRKTHCVVVNTYQIMSFECGIVPWESEGSCDVSLAHTESAPHAICLAALKAMGAVET
jgi:hypothetical protein